MTGIVRAGIGVQVGTSGTATDNFSIYQPDTPDGTVRISNGSPETPTDVAEFDSSGNFKFNSGYGSVATAYACRAWVNFNGTGTVAIRASGNVTGITDNGTGQYTVNFTNAMPDANYSIAGTTSDELKERGRVVCGPMFNNTGKTTSTTAITIERVDVSARDDMNTVNVAIFR